MSSESALPTEALLPPELEAEPPTPTLSPPSVFSLRGLAAAALAGAVAFGALPLPSAGRRGGALFAAVATAWATEAAPAWVVSVAVVPLATALRLPPGLDPRRVGSWLALVHSRHAIYTRARAAANLDGFSDSVVFLILGSLTLGVALNAHGLDDRLGRSLLRRSRGCGPGAQTAGVLVACTLLSGVVGNATAAVASMLALTPVVREMPRASRLPQCLVAAAALGCNVGGTLTPTASSQNAVAVGALAELPAAGGRCVVSFGAWVAAVGPLTLALLAVAWALLMARWRPQSPGAALAVEGEPAEALPPLRRSQRAVAAIVAGTALGWALFPLALQPSLGAPGVFSLVPVLALFGSGLLRKHDLGRLDWSVPLLLGGGVCLGRAVGASGAMAAAAAGLRRLLNGASPAMASAVFSLLPLVAANFLSHSVAAIALLPLIADSASPGHAAATVLAAVVCDTSACALPVSSLPNLVAFAAVDGDGVPYLAVCDFWAVGVAFQAAAYALTSTLGYAWFSAVMTRTCRA